MKSETRAMRILPGPLPPPEAEVHLIMSVASAKYLRSILETTNTGEFYQALDRLLGR
jgi:hypothetical protein